MAMNLPSDLSKRLVESIEDTFGVPRGLLSKDPHAAAIVATTPPLAEEADAERK